MTEPQLTYYPLGEGVTAFSTTRHGGFSRGNYGEFNVNRYCGDAPEAIRQNRRLRYRRPYCDAPSGAWCADS